MSTRQPDPVPDTRLAGRRSSLVIPDEARRELARLSLRAYPSEGCGLLLGERTQFASAVREVTWAENLNQERAVERYELDPLALLHAEDRARAQGLEVVGVWHTHPDRPAEPSRSDLRAAWEGWSYVIVSVYAGSVSQLRSWRLQDGAFSEEELRG